MLLRFPRWSEGALRLIGKVGLFRCEVVSKVFGVIFTLVARVRTMTLGIVIGFVGGYREILSWTKSP